MYPIFIDCPVGFVGDTCATSCPYPSYGALCNETCDCLKSSCHHIYGCNNISSTSTGKKGHLCFLLSRRHLASLF